MVEKDKVQVRVQVEGDLLEKFDALRSFYGVQGYAELVRIIVNERYRLLQDSEKEEN